MEGITASREQEVAASLIAAAQDIMKLNPRMSRGDAMKEVTDRMLKDNPYTPPKDGSSPINTLPPELLSYIFEIGTRMDEEDDEADEDHDSDCSSCIGGPAEDAEWEDIEEEDEKAPIEFDEIVDVAVDEEKTVQDHDSDDDEEVRPKVLPFPVLASHVCTHWRSTALGEPSLWTTLLFTLGVPIERGQAYLERSGALGIHILLDCDGPESWNPSDDEAPTLVDPFSMEEAPVTPAVEDELPFLSTDHLTEIINMLSPALSRWLSFDLQATMYKTIHHVLEMLSALGPAPMLAGLRLYHHEDCDDFTVFKPAELATKFAPFYRNVNPQTNPLPNLKNIALWGVHLDWTKCLPFLQGLEDLELAYHTDDVRPSFSDFSSIITNSPELKQLSLAGSGPILDDEDQLEIFRLEALRTLVLEHNSPSYVARLLLMLDLPNLKALTLEFEGEDYTGIGWMLAGLKSESKTGEAASEQENHWLADLGLENHQRLINPFKNRRSVLSGLDEIKIGGFPCEDQVKYRMLGEMKLLRDLEINCSCGGGEEAFFEALAPTNPSPATDTAYCPLLDTIRTTGIDGDDMCRLVSIRGAKPALEGIDEHKKLMENDALADIRGKEAQGFLDNVFICLYDEVSDVEEQYIRARVETLDFFEAEDDEDDIDELGMVVPEEELDDDEPIDDDDD
ncbi:hypothetical protein C8J56DRAFT_936562 [Mycena floridula]|nr:hypothetical protein C8J56DRAFT_936562 [Mycena floridula]